MYPKNAASPQRVAIGAVVQISDGAVQTSGVSISVLPQGTTASAGGGTTAYEQGIVHYLPTQAETNYASFILIAYKTGCIPVSATVVTTASAVAGYAGLDWATINAPTTTVSLTNTTVGTVTTATTATNLTNLPAITSNWLTAAGIAASALNGKGDWNVGKTGYALTATTGLGNQTSNITGTISTVTTLTNLPAITSNWLTAAGIAASALDGKGDWNVGKTGYALTATTGLGNQTSNITGNLSGSVGSVTGAVGSVTGAVGSVTGAVGSVTARVTANTDQLAGAAVTATTSVTFPAASTVATTTGAVGSVTGAVGSVTGLTAANLDATISSRMATYTQPTGFLAATFPGTVASTTNITAGTITNLTNAPTAGDLTATMKTSVNAEVVDALATDTYAEPGQAAPAASASLSAKIGYLYKAWRNKSTQTATTYSLYADNTTTVDQKATVSDDGTTFTRDEIASGP